VSDIYHHDAISGIFLFMPPTEATAQTAAGPDPDWVRRNAHGVPVTEEMWRTAKKTVVPVSRTSHAAVQRALIAWLEDHYPGTRWGEASEAGGPIDGPDLRGASVPPGETARGGRLVEQHDALVYRD
jgi:hypothetical protein